MTALSALEKLRQRKLIQWALVYVATAWVVAQVAEVVAEPWNLPMAGVRALHVLLVGGLPLVLTLAWFHGERGHQRVLRSEAAILTLIVAGTLFALISLGSGDRPGKPVSEPSALPSQAPFIEVSETIPRLAILAFLNLGAPADSFLADGLTAELGSRLSGLRGLALLSPSSAKAFKGSTQTPSEFGLAMGADYVLLGNVFWERNEVGEALVRVIPEVIRVADNTQVWSAQLDRPFENALAVQSEIALEVAEQLRITLSAPERADLGTAPTQSALAWEAYLKGIQILPEGHGAEQDFRQARLLLAQATTLDPVFKAAWVSLAEADFGLYWFGYDTRPEQLLRGLESVERALEIDPSGEDARLALGEYHYRRRDWDPALIEYSAVYNERPNDAKVLARLGFLWRRQGLIEQGLEALERSMALDPLNANTMNEVAYTRLFLGRDADAAEINRKARTINPDDEWTYLMGVMICWTGGGDASLACAREHLSRFPDALSTYPAWFWVLQSSFEGKPEEALARIENYPEAVLVMQHVYLPVELVQGMLLEATGRELEGRAMLQEALILLRREAEKNPTDERMILGLGLALAYLGDRDEAIEMAERALAMMPRQRDALRWSDVAYCAAEIFARVGDDRRALDTMAKILSSPTPYRGTWWTHNPAFTNLRHHPRFIDLLGLSPADS